jgi:putative endonuclease
LRSKSTDLGRNDRVSGFVIPSEVVVLLERYNAVEGPAVMKRHSYFVYMVASKSRVLYIGMTGHFDQRIWEHKQDLIDGFSKPYRCHRLVYYESFDDVKKAIDREKQLKRWSRAKKVWLIERMNPTWEDLAEGLGEKQVPPLAS